MFLFVERPPPARFALSAPWRPALPVRFPLPFPRSCLCACPLSHSPCPHPARHSRPPKLLPRRAAKVSEQLKQCQKILQFLMQHKDAEPFLHPVDWKAMGLLDYPKVVKTPMDLGSVKAKLERGDYSCSKEFRHDANLVWTNCMTYNADGSDYYLIASNLKKVFEEKYSKMIKEDEEPLDFVRPPTLVDKKMCCQNIYNISAEDLGKVVQILDQKCEVSQAGTRVQCVCA